MNPDQAAASFWAAFLRNRNVDVGTAADGAIPVAGGYAIHVAGTELSRALGAGSTRELREVDLTVVEEFYTARGEPSRFELREDVLVRDEALLRARGYADEPLVLGVYEGPVDQAAADGGVTVRPTSDRRAWAELSVRAQHAAPDVEALRRTMQVAAAAAQVLVVAQLDGEDVGVGALSLVGELALLSGAAVLPPYRGRGVHRALLAARLTIGRARGANQASLKTTLDSPVERTALAAGFTRTALLRRIRRDDR